MEQHQLPLVATRLVVLNGSDANPVDKAGLSSFTTQMLPEGTERRSSLQVADDAAQIGASVRTLTISDDSIVSDSYTEAQRGCCPRLTFRRGPAPQV